MNETNLTLTDGQIHDIVTALLAQSEGCIRRGEYKTANRLMDINDHLWACQREARQDSSTSIRI